jgi:hypothetical protein
MAVLRLSQVAKADEPEHVRLDLCLRNLLAHTRIPARSPVTGERGQLRNRTLESSRLRQAAALESEYSHRDLPAGARLADHVPILDLCA